METVSSGLVERHRNGEEDEAELKSQPSYKTQQDVLEAMCWEKFDNCDSPDFFQVLELAQDGGFSEVRDLWNFTRYIRAVLAIAMLFSNLGTIVINDSHYLAHATQTTGASSVGGGPESDEDAWVRSISGDYMISGILVDKLFYLISKMTGCEIMIHSPRIALVSALELVLLALLLLKGVSCGIRCLTTRFERIKWCMAQTFFWEVLPELTSFSAMRLLHFATPSVVLTDLNSFMEYQKHRGRHDGRMTQIRLWLQFVLKKLICFVVGVDAFLFKVRVAYQNIHKEDIEFWNLLSVAMFIVQVLGIVQLTMFVRGRIFLFIFGGEDSIMKPAEEALQNVWQAMLVRRIWRSFPPLQATAVLITFDEDDFQKLVLNESADLEEAITSSSSE